MPKSDLPLFARKSRFHFAARCYANGVTIQRLVLILAGAIAVAGIAFSMILAHKGQVTAPVLVVMLLGTYVVGLGLGGLVLSRRG